MRKILLYFIFFILLGCKQSFEVGLYKDKIIEDSILAIFPSSELEQALTNCQSIVELYKADDRKNNFMSITTGQEPVYYCQQIK